MHAVRGGFVNFYCTQRHDLLFEMLAMVFLFVTGVMYEQTMLTQSGAPGNVISGSNFSQWPTIILNIMF